MNPYEPIRDERTREQRVGEYKTHQRLVAFRSRRRRAVRRFPKHLRPIRWTIYNINSALWAIRKAMKK